MTEGVEYTVQQTLDMARGESVVLGHRMGRLTARGASSPELTNALHQNERALVRHFGGSFYNNPLTHSRRSRTASDWFKR